MYEVPIRMPKMSMTMTEGDVVEWLVAPGDEVSSGDTVCTVMTDKVDMDVEAPVTGTVLRIDVTEGTVPVGEPIGWISSDKPDPMAGLLDDDTGLGEATEPTDVTEQPGDDPADRATAPAEPVTSAEPTTAEPAPAPTSGPVAAVPRARGLAREHDIDLTTVTGTGPEGRVLVSDIEALVTPAAAGGIPAPAAPSPAFAPPTAPRRMVAPSPTPVRATAPEPGPRAKALRSAVAKVMTASAAVPQFTVWRDLDLDTLEPVRSGISWTTLLLRGYAMALRNNPSLAVRFGEDPNPAGPLVIGIAVDTPDGLMVPTFTDPDVMAVTDLDRQVRAVTAATRNGRVESAHLRPAVATLSNLGGFAVDRFQALLTPPQTSVLATGAVQRRPIAVPGGLGVGLRMTVGLGVDHRTADGADAARLLMTLAEAFNDPIRLLGPPSHPATTGDAGSGR